MSCLGAFTCLFSCMVLLIVHSSDGSEIINGTEVKPHSLPYMALLQTTRPECGGILIDKSWVLTAAHCMKHSKIEKVLLGVHSINADEENSRQVRKFPEHFPHPWYDNDTRVNDIMLLKLNEPVKETETVRYLKLGDAIEDPAAGTSCMVAGWGQTKNNGSMSDVLMSVNVIVVDREKCNSAEYYKCTTVITSGMICAGSDGENQADTCGGDSGGPLVCSGGLVGVTSFGPEVCGQIHKPGVYSYLTVKQLSWIKDTMKKSDI